MQRCLKYLAIATLAMIVIAPVVEAQDTERRQRGQGGQRGQRGGQRGGFGFFGGGRGGGGLTTTILALTQVKAVQEEVDMDAEQVADAKKINDERGPRPNIDFQKLREMSEEERNKVFAKFREDREKLTKKKLGKLEEVLLPPQFDRVKEIAVQVLDVRALSDATIAADLEITDAQKKKMEEAAQAQGRKMQELFASFRGGNGGENVDRDAIRKKMEDLRKESNAATLAVLTSDQKKAFEEMKGDKFNLPEGALRTGRGGFGGRGGAGGRGGRPGGGGRPQRPGGGRPQRPGGNNDN